MKRILVLLAVMCVAIGMQAQTVEQRYQQGNALYQQGKFAEPAAAYETILQAGYTGGEICFNLGNAYYKQGNMGKAILNFERALRFLPADDDVRHNLQLANLQIVDRIDPAPRLFLWDWWDGIKDVFSLNAITWLTWLMVVFFLGSVALILLARTYALRKSGLIASIATGVMVVMAVAIFSGKVIDANSNEEAVITAAIATAKNSPDAKSSDAFVIHAGLKVRISDSIGQWLRIRLVDGKVGWVEIKSAERI
ncbi:MAG: tetratricopeptide repeat protein [Ignavibacteriae bacterium]|nr:tetratricopeptide repeat protein [Ignavibacteriota bacterium]